MGYKGWLKIYSQGFAQQLPKDKTRREREADWLAYSWGALFTANMPSAHSHPEPGEYRCIFIRDDLERRSRHFYFESFPEGLDEPVCLLLRVVYFEPGRVKHVNVRRAWQIDVNELSSRATGHTRTPIPPLSGMSKFDSRLWEMFTRELLWDPSKPAEEEKGRADAALERLLSSNLFCRASSTWGESQGACVTGGPIRGQNTNCMVHPGWDFTSAERYVVSPAYGMLCF
jgi:hypothetical protein